MTQTLRFIPRMAIFTTCLALLVASGTAQANKPATKAPATQPWRDISGMYTFLQDGEFVQINVEREESTLVGSRGPAPEARSRMTSAPEPSGESTPAVVHDKPTLEKTSSPFPKPRAVTGFISRFGDLESDKGAFLDQFFSKGTVYGDDLSFTTKALHGVWFEFKGKVERGPGKAPAEEGYYVIRGTLKRLSTEANSKQTISQVREVVMKSFPDLDAADEKPTRQ